MKLTAIGSAGILAPQIPEFNLDGNNSLKHNGSAKDLASVMENLKKSSLVSRQNQTLNTQVTSSSTQQVSVMFRYVKFFIDYS